MVNQDLKKIFLSASIPDPDGDRKFYDSADIVAIRDAVRALATVVIPKAHLIWGGHPSITPLIRFVMERINSDVSSHITLYQSLFFEDEFPTDNFAFENIFHTERRATRQKSLELMRNRLINDNDFSVGIFIGGMEGVYEEFELFTQRHPNALVLPVASTGAAAKILYDNYRGNLDERLLNDYAYMSLFRGLLSNLLI